jgi:cyanate permease
MTITAPVGGKLIAYGRHKILCISALIGILGISMTLFINIYLLLFGKLLYGVSVGLIAVSLPRYMDEVLPSNIVGTFGALYCFSFAIAT